MKNPGTTNFEFFEMNINKAAGQLRTRTWGGNGGSAEVLRIARPRILASAGHSICLFTDRMMLKWYSEDAMNAAFPAGLTSFSLSCFFIGTVGYANSFVAQYYGADAKKRVGTAVWQGIFMAFIGAFCMVIPGIFAPEIFAAFKHLEEIQELEVVYFRYCAFSAVIPLLTVAFSTFWGGRGKTNMIMIVNLLITLLNVPFNKVLIFGMTIPLPFCNYEIVIPRLGLEGAAIGTILSGIIGLSVFVFAFFLPKENRTVYNTCHNIFDKDLFKRLVRFGAPTGFQLFLDLTAFNVFVIILGQINKDVQTASTVAFSINSIAFIPMIGLGQTVSILVGQGVGGASIDIAVKSLRSARLLLCIYLVLMGACFSFWPDPILRLFELTPGSNAEHLTRVMLYFISAYLLFDGFSILYGSAIKGAGDTKFSMYVGASLAWFMYAIPVMICHFVLTRESVMAYLGRERAESLDVWILWTLCVLYIMACGVIFYLRYRTGKWQKMKVIESEANDHPRGAIPKEPGVDVFLP